MLFRVLLFSSMFVSFCGSVKSANIDLTPTEVLQRDGLDAGQVVRALMFHEGPRKIFYKPNSDWKWSGGANHLTFLPNGIQSAKVEIVTAMMPGIKTPEDRIAKLKELIKTLVPVEATDPVYGEVLPRFFPMGNVDIVEMSVTYIINNQKLTKSLALYINPDGTTIQWITTAPTKNFDKLLGDVRSSIFSWLWQ